MCLSTYAFFFVNVSIYKFKDKANFVIFRFLQIFFGQRIYNIKCMFYDVTLKIGTLGGLVLFPTLICKENPFKPVQIFQNCEKIRLLYVRSF